LKPENGLQMLPQWKKHLGQDDKLSWIMTSEPNHVERSVPTFAVDRGSNAQKTLHELATAQRRKKMVVRRTEKKT